MNTNMLALNFLRAMQVTMQYYILPDSKISDREFASMMIGHLDGPQQRELQAALEAAQVEPNSNLHLSELMRGLELSPSLAAGSPKQLFVIGQAIATQAKEAMQVDPVAYADARAFEASMESGEGCSVWPTEEGYEVRPGQRLTLLYTSPQQAAPGWQLVPIEPTPEMLPDAWRIAARETGVDHDCLRHIYKAMLAACPKYEVQK